MKCRECKNELWVDDETDEFYCNNDDCINCGLLV